jgi:HD-like signal output (HDOD) protein
MEKERKRTDFSSISSLSRHERHDDMTPTASTASAVVFQPADPANGAARQALVDKILANPRLPSPPTLALQVFQMSGQENCSVKEISDLLSHDPGMCAKILKTLNSAGFGGSRAVTSVRQAVTTLGSRPLRSLVLGLALPVMQSGVSADAGLRRFWKKSVAGAVMARELASRCLLPSPDDEMAASLLRDLGMILLHQAFAEKYRPMWLGEPSALVEEQCAWEARALGAHHAEVSAGLLDRWKLPQEIVEPIRFHHQPELLPSLSSQLVERTNLLHFVSRLTELEERCKNTRFMDGILQTARERYLLERSALEDFLGAVRPKIEALAAVLGVDAGACPDFDELLATGCEELVQASLAAGSDADVDEEDVVTMRTFPRLQLLLEDPSQIVPGTRILQYDVIQVLGRGAMGIVLKALDAGLGRHVAIKLLAPEMAGSEKARQRFALEARFAAVLRHENVVAIYAVHEVDEIPLLVMECVEGASLQDLLEQGRTFSIAEIARIGRQTALGLAAAHEARLIHRDIKPANILLEAKTLRARVADFGLARAVDEDFNLSQPGLLLGTPYFMSPEQVDGATLTAATDLFSLGSVLYALCTGQLPFDADTMSGLLYAVAEKTTTPINLLNPHVPAGLVAVIERLHQKDPAARFPSADAVAQALKPWCD